jgi:Fe-S cluster biosynthesis and repair protein YggX
MTRTVNCAKLNKPLEGLDSPPFPGELGKRVYHHISKEAWESWLDYQTRLINEYRLNMTEAESRTFIERAMKQFLFGEKEDDETTRD